MTGNEKFVRRVVANCILGAVIIAVFGVSFAFLSRDVSTADAPIYKGGSSDKVSLMVNVYWGTEYIQPMLDIFAENGVTTTFFVGGMWVRDNEETLKKICAAGHEIANHGYFHKDGKDLSYAQNKSEIVATNDLLKAMTGKTPALFAPPSGSYGKDTLKACEDLNMKVIMWSRDTIDWRDKNTEVIYTRATDKVEAGEMILAHPTYNTAEALPDILKYYKEHGLNAVTVSQIISKTV